MKSQVKRTISHVSESIFILAQVSYLVRNKEITYMYQVQYTLVLYTVGQQGQEPLQKVETDWGGLVSAYRVLYQYLHMYTFQ